MRVRPDEPRLAKIESLLDVVGLWTNTKYIKHYQNIKKVGPGNQRRHRTFSWHDFLTKRMDRAPSGCFFATGSCVTVCVLATVLLQWTSVGRNFWNGSEVSHRAESLSAAHVQQRLVCKLPRPSEFQTNVHVQFWNHVYHVNHRVSNISWRVNCVRLVSNINIQKHTGAIRERVHLCVKKIEVHKSLFL